MHVCNARLVLPLTEAEGWAVQRLTARNLETTALSKGEGEGQTETVSEKEISAVDILTEH